VPKSHLGIQNPEKRLFWDVLGNGRQVQGDCAILGSMA